MNRQGVLIEELPFLDSLMEDFRARLTPIFRQLYGGFVSANTCFDSHKAFTVDYRFFLNEKLVMIKRFQAFNIPCFYLNG